MKVENGNSRDWISHHTGPVRDILGQQMSITEFRFGLSDDLRNVRLPFIRSEILYIWFIADFKNEVVIIFQLVTIFRT